MEKKKTTKEEKVRVLPMLTPQDIVDIIRDRSDNPTYDRLNLSGLDLSGINFVTLCRRDNKSDFRGASFRGSDLSRASFTGLSMQGCDFTGANLTDTDLTGCDLEYAIGLPNG